MLSPIRTGRAVGVSGSSSSQPTADDSVGIVFFGVLSQSKESAVFRIAQGQGILFTAYHLAQGDEVEIYKISPIVQDMPSGGACTGAQLIHDTGIIRAEVPASRNNSLWKLTTVTPIGTLSVPGYYRLKLNNESAVGQVIVEGEVLNGAPYPQYMDFGR